jgi:hypothetical protein
VVGEEEMYRPARSQETDERPEKKGLKNTGHARLTRASTRKACRAQFSSVSSRSLHAHSTTVSKDGSAPLGQHKY